jgi:alpha-L-rhamnosidase
MKREIYLRRKIAVFLSVLLFLTGHSQAQTVSVTNLRCEYLTDPLGIDIQYPRLSWELMSNDKDKKQKAYQILASTDIASLQANKAEVWDSKKTTGNRTNQIACQGIALQANTLYF